MTTDNNSLVSTEVDIDDLFDADAENLYDVLGLRKTATPAEIRRAYRKASMNFHPDRNRGDADAKRRFQSIKEAYEVLSDLVLREFYDNTGFRRPTEEQLRSKALDHVNQTFSTVIDQMASEADPRFDISHQDPVDVVKQVIMQTLQNINEARTNLQRAISRYEYLQRKFKRKAGSFSQSPVGTVLVAKIENSKKQMSLSQLDVIINEYALGLADEYTCPHERPQPVYTTQTININWNSGGPTGSSW